MVARRVLTGEGFPLASKHGVLKVGSVNPVWKRSVSQVVAYCAPTLKLCAPVVQLSVPLAPAFVSDRRWASVAGRSANRLAVGSYSTSSNRPQPLTSIRLEAPRT